MKRRQFLTNASTLLLGSLTLPKILSANNFPLTQTGNAPFSLNLVTDQPDKAIGLVDKFFKNSKSNYGKISFEEIQLTGNHVSDIAFVKNGKLVDFRKETNFFTKELGKISKQLELPKKVTNPKLIKFYNQSPKPEFANVFSTGILVDRLALKEDFNSKVIKNSKGEIEFSIQNGKAKITEATCKHKTCLSMGKINKAGESLVCIPNQITIALEGTKNGLTDSVTF